MIISFVRSLHRTSDFCQKYFLLSLTSTNGANFIQFRLKYAASKMRRNENLDIRRNCMNACDVGRPLIFLSALLPSLLHASLPPSLPLQPLPIIATLFSEPDRGKILHRYSHEGGIGRGCGAGVVLLRQTSHINHPQVLRLKRKRRREIT